jgi:peroxiredoxin Q/BCP
MTHAPRVGAIAPALELPATTIDQWRLENHKGHRVVIAFYPHDFGLLCTRQLHGYTQVCPELVDLDAMLAVVSCDSLASHRRFSDEHHFPFALLSDADGTVSAAWGLTGPKQTAKRASFVIDPSGVVRDAFVSRTGATWRSPRELLSVVAAYRRLTA